MPKPMHRSRSLRRLNRVTRSGANVIHYKRRANSLPHCAICGNELNGISLSKNGGKSRRTNSRIFGGVLCSGCSAEVVKLGSRVENGEMRLNDIGIKQRMYVLQLVAH